ncbi:hypothetical protein PAESOLCIP111_06603 [Paenibacillus solanacearum]|uniref:Uncharacterized protein n=1 Tax=Paenibacillus solanacearum TaxID=2048548 RepID=A0A916K880_9BACL|nr:hypothetical protein [Paenibacillus solanacearum]CAG7652689.1 hypothetical protein PAESOLCIP111_06603 [Paenibacillus solanacearum]
MELTGFDPTSKPLFMCCSEDNDMYRTLQQLGISIKRYESVPDALCEIHAETGLFVLADQYPSAAYSFDEAQQQAALSKRLKLYIEYPQSVAGYSVGLPQSTDKERVVVTADFFAPEHQPMTIMTMHSCWYVPMQAQQQDETEVHLRLGRVAGYDKAVYGLPNTSVPLLWEWTGRNVLIAASALSHCIRGRYAPNVVWRDVWKRILRWAGYPQAAELLSWEPVVRTQWSKQEPLPLNAETQARQLSMKWFRAHAAYSIDLRKGAIEGFESNIRYDGKQLMRAWLRADCIAESAMVFAYDYSLTQNPESKQLAESMLDSVWMDRNFYNDQRDQPDYGMVNWYDRRKVFYGDDNARVIWATLAARHALNNDRWDERILTCLLANLRTTGTNGFRRGYLETSKSFVNGRDWHFYQNEDFIEMSPHYQCYLWSCYLWAYTVTGFEPFLTLSKKAIRLTMEATPATWKWTNGLTQEIARMVLPLSMLVEIEDTEEHRDWLLQMTDMLLSRIEPCGSIRDMLGPIDNGRYPPPRSNEEYGHHEASLMQEEGDPVCDLLYTANWALIGLHEASTAIKDDKLKEAVDRLIAFLCRIQVRSEAHPYLDGAWMRSFDDVLWEYWGSSADNGWGPWCVESGWTNSWICSVLAMRESGARLFDRSRADRFRSLMPQLIADMDLDAVTN